MKVMIDIPEETYNKMRRGEKLYPADANVAIFAIETGIPLEDCEDAKLVIRKGATNGDIIKAIFSIARIEDAKDGYLDVYGLDECKYEGVWISKEWWNSPYKGEQNEINLTGAEDIK